MYSVQQWEDYRNEENKKYNLIKGVNGLSKRVYLKKSYLHLDPRFWFPNRSDEIKTILANGLKIQNNSHKREEWYSFQPFLKIITKTPRYKFNTSTKKYELETKHRPIIYASHRDSLIFGYYSFFLTQKYQEYIRRNGYSDCVLAYRSDLGGKSNIQFSQEAFQEIRQRKECVAVALDIKGFFDNIDHDILLAKWTKVMGAALPPDHEKVFSAITKYSYINRNSFLKKFRNHSKKNIALPGCMLDLVPGKKSYEKFDLLRKERLIVQNRGDKNASKIRGIPQGSPISSVLSNIYFIDFDEHVSTLAHGSNIYYRRYCDDILLVGAKDEVDSLLIKVIAFLKKVYDLEIQDSKLEKIEFANNQENELRGFNLKKIQSLKVVLNKSIEHRYYKGLQYLGFEFDGQREIVRSSSLSRYHFKMRKRIVKTVSMAYSGKRNSDKIWKQQLYHRYTHLGKRNFLTYVYNSASKEFINSHGDIKSGFNSLPMRKQVKSHFDILKSSLTKKNLQRFNWKKNKGRSVKLKTI